MDPRQSAYYGSTYYGSTYYGSTYYGSTYYGSTYYGAPYRAQSRVRAAELARERERGERQVVSNEGGRVEQEHVDLP